MTIQDKILAQSTSLFMRFGIKSMTMDDLAKHMGISKKTLYQTVENKADLVYKVMQQHIQIEVEQIRTIQFSAINAVDEMMKIVENVASHMQEIDLSIIYDLQRHFPEAFDLFENFRQTHVRNAIQKNLKRGIDEGLYRDGMDVDIISGFYISSIVAIFDQKNFSSKSYSFLTIYGQFIKYHLHGILSAQGIKIFNKIQSKVTNTK